MVVSSSDFTNLKKMLNPDLIIDKKYLEEPNSKIKSTKIKVKGKRILIKADKITHGYGRVSPCFRNDEAKLNKLPDYILIHEKGVLIIELKDNAYNADYWQQIKGAECLLAFIECTFRRLFKSSLNLSSNLQKVVVSSKIPKGRSNSEIYFRKAGTDLDPDLI